MPSPSSNSNTNGNAARRSQPVAVVAPPRTVKGKSNTNNKHPRASPGSESGSSGVGGASGASGPGLSDISRASKKIGKAVRSGKNGGKQKMKTNKVKVGGGPEAELSEDEDLSDYDGGDYNDYNDVDVDELVKELGSANVPYERIVQGAEGKSVPRSEIGMDSLIAVAKVRPDPNISRGYEMLTNPAARMVITFDREESTTNSTTNTNTNPTNNANGRVKAPRKASIAFSDESEWENVQFEMDEFEGTTEPVLVPVSATIAINAGGGGAKSGYADIVKRTASVAA